VIIGATVILMTLFVAVRWRFFYPTTTRRIPLSLINPLDELGKLGARSSIAVA